MGIDSGRDGSCWTDERGQSEVVGTILLVAVVVVLLTLLGQFVFGLDVVNADRAVAPQVSFDTSVDGEGDLTVEHQSGDSLEMSTVTVYVGGEVLENPAVGEVWTAGEAMTIEHGEGDEEVDDGDDVRIVWRASDTQDSDVLFEYEYDG